MTAPDAAARDLDQPWAPAGAPAFKVGDRVKCVPSSECRAGVERSSLAIKQGQVHPAERQGAVGTIRRLIDPVANRPGHCWVVWWDDPIRTTYTDSLFGERTIDVQGDTYAAAELEPVEDTAR